MAIRTSLPLDREKRSAHQPACLCRFRGALSWIEINNRRRRTVARGSSGIGARTQDQQSRFAYRIYFTGRIARDSLCVAYFPAPERNWSSWKPGRRSEFNAGSDGERVAGFCHASWRDSRSDREWRERGSGSRARSRSVDARLARGVARSTIARTPRAGWRGCSCTKVRSANAGAQTGRSVFGSDCCAVGRNIGFWPVRPTGILPVVSDSAPKTFGARRTDWNWKSMFRYARRRSIIAFARLEKKAAPARAVAIRQRARHGN